MPTLKAIAAVAQNGVIGMDDKIPWHISDEFKHFKSTTMGGVLLMGRRTWDSLGGRPLPGRENAVITSRPAGIVGAAVFPSLDKALRHYEADSRQVWICGGAQLYKTALPMCSEILLSRIKLSPRGNVYFPDIASDFSEAEVLLRHSQFDVIRYVRR